MTDHKPDLEQPDSDQPATVDPATLGALGYDGALQELETILDELERQAVDVDTLAQRVERAAALVAHCRARLDVVRDDVAAVVDDLNRTTEE